jgi:AcrR family transcriptional regulator
MGTKERRERQKEAVRQEILDSARELFVSEGYENVSMRRIAEKIEYSPTTIYLYFEDKADLLISICEETFARLSATLETIARAGDDPVDTLKRGCHAYVDFGLKHPNHYRVTFISQYPDLAGRYRLADSMGMRAYGFLRDSVSECVRLGRFHDTDIEMITQALWAAGHGVTSLLITKKNFPWSDADTLVSFVIDTFIDGLCI